MSEISGKEKWVIISIYNRKEWKEMEQRLEEIMEEIKGNENINVIIGGDFNIKIGTIGSVNEVGMERRSKDKTIRNEGRNFVEWIKRKGWYVMNGAFEGD